ncbi:Homoserine kinase [bacterium HR29]|jgi:homoserine kinase type II|nr:Homoserine kinase [bacterium HR29]
MAGRHPPGPDVVRALRLFGIEAEGIFPIPGGDAGAEWRAVAEGRTFLVRRHHPARPDQAIAWEHSLRAYLEERGWPGAPPLVTRDGRDVVAVDGERFSLYPFRPGRPLPARSSGAAPIIGRLLARLHRDARRFPLDEQPEGLGLAWELDTLVQTAGLGTLGELLVAFAREAPALAAAFRRERFRLVRDLARCGYADLPRGVVFLTLCRETIPFEGGVPSSLLRLELAHWDALAFDVAAALVREAWSPARPATFDVAAALGLLEGYEALRPLEPEEWQALPVLVRAAAIWEAVRALARWWSEGDPRAPAVVRRTLERQLPAVESHARRLVELAAGAARRR